MIKVGGITGFYKAPYAGAATPKFRAEVEVVRAEAAASLLVPRPCRCGVSFYPRVVRQKFCRASCAARRWG